MTNELIKEFIASSLWAKDLTLEQLSRVQRDALDLSVNVGQTVCHRGGRSDYWYGIVEGLVKVSNVLHSGRPTTFLGVLAGGWIGEDSVMRSEPRSYDLVALRASRLALIPTSTFHWLLDTSLAFNRFMLNQLNARLAQFVLRLEHARSYNPDQHVAHCLGELFNSLLYPKTATTLQISQEEIAFLAGVSRQIVNRTLRHLENVNLMQVSYGFIEFLNADGLRAFASDPNGQFA